MRTAGSLVRVFLSVLPSTILLFILYYYYPKTGLGIIIAIPIIYLINISMFLVANHFSLKKSFATKTFIWVITVFISLIITLYIFPQDYGPTVTSRLIEKIF